MKHDGSANTSSVGGRQNAPCTLGCPAGIDVPRYIGYVALGRFGEAAAVVRERIPFPAICGHVCYRPCESVCRRAFWEAPVAINAIKRAAVERDAGVWRQHWSETIAPPTGRRVAIVGSGPAGLTAAYYLGKRGDLIARSLGGTNVGAGRARSAQACCAPRTEHGVTDGAPHRRQEVPAPARGPRSGDRGDFGESCRDTVRSSG